MDSSMSRSNKAKGRTFENDLIGFWRDRGYSAERLARKGSRDEGDVAVSIGDSALIIEAKNVKAINLADFIKQSEVEAENYSEARGIDTLPLVVVKRRQKSVEDSYVVTTLATFEELLKRLSPPF